MSRVLMGITDAELKQVLKNTPYYMNNSSSGYEKKREYSNGCKKSARRGGESRNALHIGMFSKEQKIMITVTGWGTIEPNKTCY